jgi:hypothetical protein
VRGRHVEAEHLDEASQARSLAFGELEHQPGQGGGVDDRMLERTFEASTHQPRVERVVAVFDQDGALGKAQEGSARVAKLGRADQHRPVDMVTAVGVRVDRSLAVHQRVEERQRAVEPEAFGANFQDEERRVACGFDVQRDELRLVQPRSGLDVRRVDGDLLPRHGFRSPARFQEKGLGTHRAWASARRAQSISAVVSPRRTRTAPA